MNGFQPWTGEPFNRSIGWAVVAVLLLAVVGVGAIVYLLIRLVVFMLFGQ